MSKLELVSLAAKRQAGELMSETDAEDGRTSHESADIIGRVRARLRIARAIGKKDPIGLQREHVFRLGFSRNHGNAAALGGQLAQNVVLDAEVVRHNMEARGLVLDADHFRGLMRAFTRL